MSSAQAKQVKNRREISGTLAQLVEQRTFNPFVVGSTPARPTTGYRQAALHLPAKRLFYWSLLSIVPKQDRDADAAVTRIERVVRVVGGRVGHTFNAGKSVAFDAAFFDQLAGSFCAFC